ncbi:hypothetical protein SNF32_05790 [Enterococcus mundtii]|nr:hypothetical protein [Enterococcus mundtii]
MTHFYKKQSLHIIVIILLLFSSLGNSISVIAETTKESTAGQISESTDDDSPTENDELSREVPVESGDAQKTYASEEKTQGDKGVIKLDPGLRNVPNLLTSLDHHFITRFYKAMRMHPAVRNSQRHMLISLPMIAVQGYRGMVAIN